MMRPQLRRRPPLGQYQFPTGLDREVRLSLPGPRLPTAIIIAVSASARHSSNRPHHAFPHPASGFLRVGAAYGHRIRKDYGVWNNDLPSFFRRHDRRTGLYVGNTPFNSRNADEITQFEGLLQQ
jgi:hypothetical protein